MLCCTAKGIHGVVRKSEVKTTWDQALSRLLHCDEWLILRVDGQSRGPDKELVS